MVSDMTSFHYTSQWIIISLLCASIPINLAIASSQDALPTGFPRFVHHPRKIYAVEKGRSVFLLCKAEGNPEPTITWYKETIPLDMSNPRFSLLNESFLQIDDAQEEDQGRYKCLAENSVGKAFSNIGLLLYVRVRHVPPYISIKPDAFYEVMPGGNVSIKCVALGLPMPYVKWRKGTVDLTPEHEIPVGKNILHLENVRESANYTCVATSKLGNVEAHTQVTVQALPRPPTNVRISDVTATSVRLSWSYDIGAENITYVIQYKPKQANQAYIEMSDITTNFSTIRDLTPYTEYEIYVIAVNVIGRGPPSTPAVVTTGETVPGEPRQVKVTALNSTAINVKWKPPSNKEQNDLIRGYQIHVQEMNKVGDLVNEPMRYYVADGNAEEYNVTGLQPDTDYSVQVAAVTRKGDGTRSRVKTIRTSGGVPTKPEVMVRLVVEIQWAPPNHTHGEILNYRLRYGRTDGSHREEMEINPLDSHTAIRDLDQGARYEFRLAGRNAFGWGQEAIVQLDTPEGVPTAAPENLNHRLQSPKTVIVCWDPPLAQYRNGRITQYGLQLNKASYLSSPEYNTTKTRMVLSSQDENTEYVFRVREYTSKGPGPWSSRMSVHTPDDVPPAPANVQAMATSDQSVEVWWDEVPYFVDILGYQVLYTQTVVEDLDQWSSKKVPLTWSAELDGLESDTMYAIRVAVVTRHGLGRLSELITVRVNPTEVPTQLRAHTVTTRMMTLSWKPPTKLDPIRYVISYGAHKEFFDSQGKLQDLHISAEIVFVPANQTDLMYTIKYLMPFTTYQVNVTAIPPDGTFRPPAKIIVTTAMSAPEPMVKPDLYDAGNGQEIVVVLPQASEEYGPISHYYLVVVPAEYAVKEPDHYNIEELSATPPEQMGSYIAAKFPGRTMPVTFALGDGKKYLGFLNKRLVPGQQYKIFVRAVVDTPQRNLYTSSAFSESLGVKMMAQT